MHDLKANNYNLDIKNPHVAEAEHSYTSAELLTLLHDSFAKSDGLLNQLKMELANELSGKKLRLAILQWKAKY